jgi:hypothetical protein
MHPASKQQQQRLVQLSKEMSRMLRHSPPPGTVDPQVCNHTCCCRFSFLGIVHMAHDCWCPYHNALLQGWVPLGVLAEHMCSKPSLDEIRLVVAGNDKVW